MARPIATDREQATHKTRRPLPKSDGGGWRVRTGSVGRGELRRAETLSAGGRRQRRRDANPLTRSFGSRSKGRSGRPPPPAGRTAAGSRPPIHESEVATGMTKRFFPLLGITGRKGSGAFKGAAAGTQEAPVPNEARDKPRPES